VIPKLPDLTTEHGDLMFLLGVLFNQQVRSETAWMAPVRLRDRLGTLEVTEIAQADPAALAVVMRKRPALHPFATSMAAHTVGICAQLIARFDARAAGVWSDRPDAATLLHRLTGFPGIGGHKAMVAIALLTQGYGIPIRGANGFLQEALMTCPRLTEIVAR
jgi:uncharacterized HhH-GPD family protein